MNTATCVAATGIVLNGCTSDMVIIALVIINSINPDTTATYAAFILFDCTISDCESNRRQIFRFVFFAHNCLCYRTDTNTTAALHSFILTNCGVGHGKRTTSYTETATVAVGVFFICSIVCNLYMIQS